MSSYVGTFVVVNCTGQTITNVKVNHNVGSNPPDSTGTIPSMAPGAASPPVTLNGQTGSNDIWFIWFTLGGVLYTKNGKQCNYEQEDAGQTCVITLGTKTFSVITPVSSPCDQNSYSSP